MNFFAASGNASRRSPPFFELEDSSVPARPARKTLLLAFDRSASARCALDYAISRAVAQGLSIHLVNVQSMPRDEAVFHGAAREEGQRVLDVARAQLDEEGIAHSSEIRFGHVATEIVECALQTRSSVVVIGARSRNALARFFSASVSAEVARRSPVPVVVVKHAVTSSVHAPWSFLGRRNAT